jgi:putative redox protein
MIATILHPVRTTKASAGAIAQQLSIGDHVLISDAGKESGGDDLGPDPHELLDAALASCTALTLHLYARRKGIALANVEAEVSHEEHDGVYRMRRDIRLTGQLTADERARLLEIANRCPVHRTLSGRFEIASQLVD